MNTNLSTIETALMAIAIASSAQPVVLMGLSVAACSGVALNAEDTGVIVRNVAAVTMPGTYVAAAVLRRASRFIAKWRR